MLRTMWKGSIQFGLVYIPVKLYAATEDKDIKLRMLHKSCMAPINYTRTCSKCGKAVDKEEIIKAYEYAPDHYVPISEEELNHLQDEGTKSIEIINFVNLNEIDPIYFEKSYFIGPENSQSTRAFSLLRQSIHDSNKIGLANIMIRAKQHLAAVRGYGSGMMLETLYYPDEIRSTKEVPGLNDVTIRNSTEELGIANQLIEQLTVTFNPQKYKDSYRQRLEKMIQDKVAGIKPEKKAFPVASDNVVDLLDALEASVKEVKPKPKPKRKSVPKKKITS